MVFLLNFCLLLGIVFFIVKLCRLSFLYIILIVLITVLFNYEYPFSLAAIISLQFYNKPFERF